MPKKYYLVTFDLLNSEGRQGEYRAAEDALKFRFGADDYWKIVKQCAIVRTNDDASTIRNTLSQKLGTNCNILVVRLRRGFAFKLKDPSKQSMARDILRGIPNV